MDSQERSDTHQCRQCGRYLYSALERATADELDRLRAENEALKSCACSDCNREILSLRAESIHWQQAYRNALAGGDVLKERIAELEALLSEALEDRDEAAWSLGSNWVERADAALSGKGGK